VAVAEASAAAAISSVPSSRGHQRRPAAELLVLGEQDGRRDRAQDQVRAGQHHQAADQQQLLQPAVVPEAASHEVGDDEGDHRLGRLQRDVQGGAR
jgi:hypothetical protein